ncbi:MAG: hypothetical protein IPI35_32240 [Deltaproteobacteria bacterium]|nr:hypothetical protein [Deltaproteobacteria bacterium]
MTLTFMSAYRLAWMTVGSTESASKKSANSSGIESAKFSSTACLLIV